MVDGLGQLDVAHRDAAGAVGAEVQRDFVVADVDVGVVLPLLGHLREMLDEADGVHEVGEAERARESLTREAPLPQLAERRLDLLLA